MSLDYPIKYINEAPPKDPKDLPEYLDRELRRISFAIFALAEGFFGKIHVEPVKKRDGLVVYADGTDFNPGGGEGIYARIAGAWVKMT